MGLDKFQILNGTDSIEVFQGTSPWVIGDGGGSLTVDAADLDIRDLAFATDKVDVSGSSVSISGTVGVTQSTSPWVVSATDLDIRDLAFATDSVDVSGSSVSITGSVAVTSTNLDIRDLAFATDKVDVSGSSVELGATTLAALESITVSATDLDIRDLAFATDKVDVSGSSITVAPDAYDVWKTTTDVAVTATAGGTQIAATALTGRLKIVVQNVGGNDIRLAESTSQVTSTRGILLKRGTSQEIELGDGAALWALGIGGASTLAVAEYAT